MAREFDVDGKWLGDHLNSCQREKCKNPTGILINCFSCHRAFCKPCWKKVSKMLRSVKVAKGLESCSIEPPQNPLPLLSSRAVLPRGQPCESSNKSAQLSDCLQECSKVQSHYVVVSDSDDSGKEPEKRADVSTASVSARSVCNVRPGCKTQQGEQNFQPTKRHFEGNFDESTKDVEKQVTKRPKSSASPSLVSVSSEKHPGNPSLPGPPCGSSNYGQDGGDQGRQYISEGRYHALQEWAMERMASEQQNKSKSMGSDQSQARIGVSILRETHDLEGRQHEQRTSQAYENFASSHNLVATSTLGKGDRENAQSPSNKLPDNGDIAVEEQCASVATDQQPGPSHCDTNTPSISNPEGPTIQPSTSKENIPHVQQTAVQSYAPTPGLADPQERTQQGPSIPAAVMAVQTRQEPNLDQHTQQSQPQIYHRHYLPRSQSLESPETYLPAAQQSSCQVSPPSGRSVQSGHVSHPPLPLEVRSTADLKLPAKQVLQQPGSPDFLTARFRQAFAGQDIADLPADQTKFGDGWLVHYNPRLPRVIDVSLSHSFQHDSAVCCVRFSPDGKHMATGSNRSVQIFDAYSGQKVWKLELPSVGNSPKDMYVRCLSFSLNGKYLAIGSEDMLTRIWSIESKEILQILTGHTHEIYSIDFASDSRTLATGSTDCTVRLWDVETGSQILCLPTHDVTIASVAISPDIRYLAAGCYDKSIRVWSVATGTLVAQLRGPAGHTAAVNSVAFSPNGKGLVSGSLDNTVKMWEFDTSRDISLGPEGGHCSGTFKDHDDFVLSVAMTLDGTWVLSGSKDNGVNFLDPHTRSCQLKILGHQNSVISVATSPVSAVDGGLFATGSSDKQAKIWVYNYVLAQQSSQLGFHGNSSYVPNWPKNSEVLRNYEQQPPPELQYSFPPPQKAPALSKDPAGISSQGFSPNIPSQYRLALSARTMAGPAFQEVSINKSNDSFQSCQKSSQAYELPRNSPVAASQASQMGNDIQTMASPREGLQVNALAPTGTEPTTFNENPKREHKKTCLDLLNATRQFALKAPQSLPQTLQKLYSVRHSLPQDDVTLEKHQEQRGKIEGEIQNLEALYQALLQHVPEEEKDGNMWVKERTVASKRRQLEEHDKKWDLYRAARENRNEINMFTKQVSGLKALVPNVIKALQDLEMFLNQQLDL